VNIWYHVGPVNEVAGRTGFAHLFEHMMFQGSGHTEHNSYFKHLEGAGASLVNGTTDFDRTNYMEDVPSNQLELALWLESDRMGFLLDRLDQSMLSNQQDVVRNERRQSIENAPYGLAQERVYQELFPSDHPYHAMVMGSHHDIQAARLEDVRDFFRRYYAPNNASLAIVGDIDVAKTKALVEKYFGSISRGPEIEPVRVTTPAFDAERRVRTTDQVELSQIMMAWITPPIFTPGDAEAEVASQILAGGKASRLYRTLVYDRKIAQNVSAEQQSLTLGSIFQITATAKPGHTVEELEAAIDAELDRLAASGPTAEELEGTKNQITTSIVTSLEQFGGFGGIANRLNQYEHHLGDPGWLGHDLERFAAVTAPEVGDFVARHLRRDARVVVQVVPGEKIIPPGPDTPPPAEPTVGEVVSAEPWRNTAPRPGPLPANPLPRARRFALPNGLPVYLVPSHELPVVTAGLILRAGSAADPIRLPGLAGFSAAMIDEGTTKRDAMAIARDLELAGATLFTGSSRDDTYVGFQSLARNAGTAMDILSDIVLDPAFPLHEIDRVRSHRITALRQLKDSPFRTASRVMFASLYGADHPYGHIVLGTEDALARTSRDDLLRFYRDAYSPTAAALVLAGDLTEDAATALATRAFGAWSGSGEAPPPPRDGTPAAERVFLIDRPGSPQSALLVAQPGVARSNPDFENLNTMNQILGGLFSSRINLNLRERHGFTYGAYSSVDENRGVAPLWVSASVRTDATGASIREILAEARAMLEREVSAEELELAKESIARSLPALFQTSGNVISTIGNLFVFDLPPEYYEGLPARLAAVSAREVLESTRRHLTPDRMIVVAVGDRREIEPQIARLGLGPIAHRNADGEVVEEVARS
jgi:zinc protease